GVHFPEPRPGAAGPLQARRGERAPAGAQRLLGDVGDQRRGAGRHGGLALPVRAPGRRTAAASRGDHGHRARSLEPLLPAGAGREGLAAPRGLLAHGERVPLPARLPDRTPDRVPAGGEATRRPVRRGVRARRLVRAGPSGSLDAARDRCPGVRRAAAAGDGSRLGCRPWPERSQRVSAVKVAPPDRRRLERRRLFILWPGLRARDDSGDVGIFLALGARRAGLLVALALVAALLLGALLLLARQLLLSLVRARLHESSPPERNEAQPLGQAGLHPTATARRSGDWLDVGRLQAPGRLLGLELHLLSLGQAAEAVRHDRSVMAEAVGSGLGLHDAPESIRVVAHLPGTG